MFDVEMLVNLGGRERTRADFERLLSQAGFRVSRVIDTVESVVDRRGLADFSDFAPG